MPKVITRFPPSPTGFLHIGGARTALFNYLFAKNQRGSMVMRFEDTDKARSDTQYEEDILRGLEWLGIKYDNERPYKQSERGEIYKKHLEMLISQDKAYVSIETRRESEGARTVAEEKDKRGEVIRFRNPNTKIEFDDVIRGTVSFDTTELGDFVIAKSLDEPLYHLAVVIDDEEMNVSHIIRGEDHISNTPRQILILEALGFKRPVYAHLPLILSPDRSKMSKRHGAVSVGEYKKMGYLPEAVVNYLALLGWNPGDDREIFTMEELIKRFDLRRVQKSGAVFDIEKLNWLNREHIKRMSEIDFKEAVEERLSVSIKEIIIKKNEVFEKMLFILKERIERFADIEEMEKGGELEYFFEKPEYAPESLYWKDNPSSALYAEHLKFIAEKIAELKEGFSADDAKDLLWNYADGKGRGEVLWPLRVALSGRERSPDPFTLIYILGVEESKRRIENAITKLNDA